MNSPANTSTTRTVTRAVFIGVWGGGGVVSNRPWR
jgi:hypothetical protein